MMASGAQSLIVDYIDPDSYNPFLAKEITHKPDEYLEAFNEAVLSILREIHPDYEQEIREKIQGQDRQLYCAKGPGEINADLINKHRASLAWSCARQKSSPCQEGCIQVTNCNTVTEGPAQRSCDEKAA